MDGGRCKKHRRTMEKARGTRHQRGYGRDHERWRLSVLSRDDFLCQPCLRAGRVNADDGKVQADHILPFDQGGARLDTANGQAICTRCHGYKTAWETKHNVRVEPWPETGAGR